MFDDHNNVEINIPDNLETTKHDETRLLRLMELLVWNDRIRVYINKQINKELRHGRE